MYSLVVRVTAAQEAGELMAQLSKVDQNASAAEHAVTCDQWEAFWEEILQLQGPFSVQELAEFSSIFKG